MGETLFNGGGNASFIVPAGGGPAPPASPPPVPAANPCPSPEFVSPNYSLCFTSVAPGDQEVATANVEAGTSEVLLLEYPNGKLGVVGPSVADTSGHAIFTWQVPEGIAGTAYWTMVTGASAACPTKTCLEYTAPGAFIVTGPSTTTSSTTPSQRYPINPMLQSVQFTLDAEDDVITVRVSGTGFGSFPRPLPFDGDTTYFLFEDSNGHWSAGNGMSPGAPTPPAGQGGLCVVNLCEGSSSTVIGDYQVWTNSEIVVSFSSMSPNWRWSSGDTVQVFVKNPQSGVSGEWIGFLTG